MGHTVERTFGQSPIPNTPPPTATSRTISSLSVRELSSQLLSPVWLTMSGLLASCSTWQSRFDYTGRGSLSSTVGGDSLVTGFTEGD